MIESAEAEDEGEVAGTDECGFVPGVDASGATIPVTFAMGRAAGRTARFSRSRNVSAIGCMANTRRKRLRPPAWLQLTRRAEAPRSIALMHFKLR